MLKVKICCQFNYLEYEPHSNWLLPNVCFFCLISALRLTFLNLFDTLSRLSLVHCKSQWSMKLSSHCNTFKMFAQLHSPHFNPNINWKHQLQLFSEFSVSFLYQTFTVKIQSFQEESMWLGCNLQRPGRICQNLTKVVNSGISVSFKHAIEEKLYEQIWSDLFCVVLFFGINCVE